MRILYGEPQTQLAIRPSDQKRHRRNASELCGTLSALILGHGNERVTGSHSTGRRYKGRSIGAETLFHSNEVILTSHLFSFLL